LQSTGPRAIVSDGRSPRESPFGIVPADIMRTGPDDRATAVWRWLPVRLAIVAIPLWVTTAALAFHIGWRTKAVIALALGVTVASPVHGLLFAAAAAPLGLLIATSIGDENFRISEAVVVAFLIGWLLRALPDRRGPAVAAPTIGWLLAVSVVASIAALAWQLQIYADELSGAVSHVVYAYFYPAGDWIGVVTGARLLEGLGLAAATVALFRRAPSMANRLPAVLAGSATIAAASSMLLSRGIGSASALQRLAGNGYRVSGHVADANAAGSYFAMAVCLAIGMAVRARGWSRALWVIMAIATAIGLQLSQSRSALAAAAIAAAVAVAWAATSRFTLRTRGALLAAVLIVGAGAGAVRVRQLEKDPEFRGAGFRAQFNTTSARMILARPVVGVGIGQYYRTSPLFLSPELAWAYGFENAHNYFLQIGAELGLVGLGTFAVWIGAAVARSVRALLRTPYDARLLGATSGVIAYLGTCLTGHPLLIGETAYPFWIQFGLMTALAGSTLLNDGIAVDRSNLAARPARSWSLVTAAAAIAIVAGGLASALRGPVSPPESQAVNGFYGWETAEDGRRFRWTEQFASIIVPKEVARVRIPVRVPTDRPAIAPMAVEVSTGGSRPMPTLVSGTWSVLDVPIGDIDPLMHVKRVNLKVDRTWQPALYIAGNADMRRVGIQVGEYELVRAR
jgi:O-antigen ligase